MSRKNSKQAKASKAPKRRKSKASYRTIYTSILNHKVKVNLADPVEHCPIVQEEFEEPGDLRGCWVTDTSEIWVTPGSSPERQLQTLLHEAAHAVDDHLGLGLSHEQVYAIGAGMAQILTPWLCDINKPRK